MKLYTLLINLLPMEMIDGKLQPSTRSMASTFDSRSDIWDAVMEMPQKLYDTDTLSIHEIDLSLICYEFGGEPILATRAEGEVQ